MDLKLGGARLFLGSVSSPWESRPGFRESPGAGPPACGGCEGPAEFLREPGSKGRRFPWASRPLKQPASEESQRVIKDSRWAPGQKSPSVRQGGPQSEGQSQKLGEDSQAPCACPLNIRLWLAELIRLADAFFGALGRLLLRQLKRFDRQLDFAGRVLLLAWEGRRARALVLTHLTLEEIFKLARSSLTLIILVGFMLGYLWSMLWFGTLSNIGGLENISLFLVSIHTIQIAPIMTTVIVLLRYGAPTTWELAVMKSGGQFQTLARMGIAPEHYLAVPRVLGSLLSVPILQLIFVLASLAGAYYMAWRYANQTLLDFAIRLSDQTEAKHFIIMGCKSVAIALSISFFCVYNGFAAEINSLARGSATIRRAMGEAFFYSILTSVLVSVFYR